MRVLISFVSIKTISLELNLINMGCSSPLLMIDSSSPLLMIDMLHSFYSPAEKKVVSIGGGGGEDVADDDTEFVGSSHGWVALFNHRSCDVFLWNPISRRRINLPAIDTLPTEDVIKVILSSSPDDSECRAVMSYGPEKRLAFCCPGGSKEWTPIGAWFHVDEGERTARAYEDFAYCKGQNRLFCVTQFGDLERWDLGDPSCPRIDWSNEEDGEVQYTDSELDEAIITLKYIVVDEQSNRVFIVERTIMMLVGPDGCSGWDKDTHPYKTVGFKVYEIEMEGGTGGSPYMESLDGLAMFVGINHSFAMSTCNNSSSLKPNSIYFTDHQDLTPQPWCRDWYNYGGHDIGIFDYQDATFSPCYFPWDLHSISRITPAPLWFIPTSPADTIIDSFSSA